MTLLRMVVRRTARNSSRRLVRDIAAADRRRERALEEGRIIDVRRPGLLGYLQSLSLARFMLLCVVVSLGLLIALPIAGLAALLIADAIQ